MKRITLFAFAAVMLADVVGFMTLPASGQTGVNAAPIYGVKIPLGYRDWPLINPLPSLRRR